MQKFYTNLFHNKYFIETFIKDVKITLTFRFSASYQRALNLLMGTSSLRPINGSHILFVILPREVPHINFHLKTNLFNLEMHMLNLLVTHILLPYVGSHTSSPILMPFLCSISNIAMWLIFHLWWLHMCTLFTLPYNIYLTRSSIILGSLFL